MFYAQMAFERAYGKRQYLVVIDAKTLMSQIALEKKDYTKATNHRRTIRDLTVRERLWDLAMKNYDAMAQTWLLRNNYAEAVEELKRGLEIAIDRSNLELQKYFYQALIDSYRKLRNTDAVYDYYTKLIDVNLQIVDKTYIDLINGLQTEREDLIVAAEDAKNRWQQRSTISKVFHIIAVIWAVLASAVLVMAYIWFEYKFKPDLVKAQTEMRMKAEEFDLLVKSQENAFRFLTNHVQTSIDSLAKSINLFEAEQGTCPVAVNSPLSRISDQINALYGFFQNFTLLLQAQSGQLRPVLVTVNIPQLTNNLFVDYEKYAILKEIKLINDVQNNTFAIADERLVEVVLRNLISNAFKYAPAGTGSISIGAKVGTRDDKGDDIAEDVNFVEIWVTDDGIGLTPEQAEILFDLNDNLLLPGDSETKGYGVGLAVCKAVIETLKGRIWAETKPNEGFCIRFCLPKIKGPEVKTLSLVEDTQETISNEDNPILLLSE
jgi:signal transduction histidine kinase